ncbi:hypothetical protein BDY21DRAFT_128738 [Lineolata rhizophorae]|uniref:Uncharacterized protein n=1 Tax=Lineolata rhizophorae TaxID=578093 RepID=A0A6A6NNH5_9PEZI|nr:hypothetical protein BDY21DRAFT_128738 [Lineolata rhizophorae]
MPLDRRGQTCQTGRLGRQGAARRGEGFRNFLGTGTPAAKFFARRPRREKCALPGGGRRVECVVTSLRRLIRAPALGTREHPDTVSIGTGEACTQDAPPVSAFPLAFQHRIADRTADARPGVSLHRAEWRRVRATSALHEAKCEEKAADTFFSKSPPEKIPAMLSWGKRLSGQVLDFIQRSTPLAVPTIPVPLDWGPLTLSSPSPLSVRAPARPTRF